jgi:mannitol/fructose-specific phosphotransferase system IIA component (Ntr-type)
MSNSVPHRLAALLRPEAIKLNLQAKQKNAALREVAELLVPTSGIANFEAFYREVLERERVSNTALGHDIAIPHARTEQCSQILIAVGRCAEGVDFDGKNQSPVRLIFLIGTPKQMVTDYLRVVGNLARLLRRDDLRQQLLDAPDAASFIKVLAEAEETPAS